MPPGKNEFRRMLERPAHFVRPRKTGGGSSRGGALVTTVLLHVGVICALVTGLHTARTLPPPVLMVRLDIAKRKPLPPPPPPLQFIHPPAATLPMPVVVIQNVPSPVHAEPPRTVPAPPTHAQQPSPQAGEGRDSFLARLLSQLNRFKHYPPEARKAHIEGVVMVHFAIDAGGNLLSCEISKSSGRPILDIEALALIRRAQPLPALPPGFPNNTLDAVVPIAFYLN